MSRKKKNGKQDVAGNALLLTAILNLIKALIDLINKLIE